MNGKQLEHEYLNFVTRYEAALHHADSTSVVVFVEEHSLRVLAVHLAKSWRKLHLSGVAGKCTDQ